MGDVDCNPTGISATLILHSDGTAPACEQVLKTWEGLKTLGIDTSTLLHAPVVHWLGRASYKDVKEVQSLSGVPS